MAGYEKSILKNIYNNCKKTKKVKFNVNKLLSGKTINRRARVGRLCYYGHIMRRERNHPLRKALRLKCRKRKEGRPCLTWTDSLKQDLNKYENMERENWKRLTTDKSEMKRKAEEIYNNESSEISEGESSEEGTVGRTKKIGKRKLKKKAWNSRRDYRFIIRTKIRRKSSEKEE